MLISHIWNQVWKQNIMKTKLLIKTNNDLRFKEGKSKGLIYCIVKCNINK
jgi:hypothetical protein